MNQRLEIGRRKKGHIQMKVAVLGLGIIGSAWAKNLIADGHTVRCWNRTPKEFPNFHSSITEAVDQADAVFIIVAELNSGVWHDNAELCLQRLLSGVLIDRQEPEDIGPIGD